MSIVQNKDRAEAERLLLHDNAVLPSRGCVNVVAKLLASQRIAREALEMRDRQCLWLHHGCSGMLLYGDDGEMQCKNVERHGYLDFKRMEVGALRIACHGASSVEITKAMAKSMNAALSHLGATREGE